MKMPFPGMTPSRASVLAGRPCPPDSRLGRRSGRSLSPVTASVEERVSIEGPEQSASLTLIQKSRPEDSGPTPWRHVDRNAVGRGSPEWKIREHYIEIRPLSHLKVVTVIELVSPSNKGAVDANHMAKQSGRSVPANATLLRSTPPWPSCHERPEPHVAAKPFDYLVCEPLADPIVTSFRRLRDPLPTIGIRCRTRPRRPAADSGCPEYVYKDTDYNVRVRYQEPRPSPLSRGSGIGLRTLVSLPPRPSELFPDGNGPGRSHPGSGRRSRACTPGLRGRRTGARDRQDASTERRGRRRSGRTPRREPLEGILAGMMVISPGRGVDVLGVAVDRCRPGGRRSAARSRCPAATSCRRWRDPYRGSPTPTISTSAIDAGILGIPVAGTVSCRKG